MEFIFDLKNDAAVQHVWNCLYKKRIIMENGLFFDENFKHGFEDFKFNMMYANRSKCIVKISAIVYEYKNRVGVSTSTKVNNQVIKEFIYLLDSLQEEFCQKEDEYAYQIRCLFALRGLLNVYFHGNYSYDQRKALEEIRSYYKQQYSKSISIAKLIYSLNMHNGLYYIIDKIIRNEFLYKILFLVVTIFGI